MRVLAACFLALCCTACGGGGSDIQGDDGLSRDIGLGNATYIILNLDAKTFSPVNTLDDLTTNSAYTTSSMVFRRIDLAAGSLTGSPDAAFGHELDETQATSAATDYFIALFELSQGQWTRIAGTSPWTTVLSDDLAGTTTADDAAPAFNISVTDCEAALSAFCSGQDFTLRLPTDEEWELAARAGVDTDYPWGDGPTGGATTAAAFDAATIARYARLQDSLDADTGPLDVSALEGNDWGFHHVIGNVWECTSDNTIRGGDWRSPVALSRLADKVDFDPDVAHPGVGFRLVIER